MRETRREIEIDGIGMPLPCRAASSYPLGVGLVQRSRLRLAWQFDVAVKVAYVVLS